MTGRMQKKPRKRSTTTMMQSRTGKTNGTGTPTHDAIAVRAYDLYEKSGFRNGSEVEFWLKAERQLSQELISA
jgi:hypothetical protein